MLDLAQATSLAHLESLDEPARLGCLLPVDALLRGLPDLAIDMAAALRFRHGNPVDLPPGLTGKIRVYADGRLLGIGEPGTDGRLWPKRLVQLAGSLL
jgi:tRNA pseudouridine55 synthase